MAGWLESWFGGAGDPLRQALATPPGDCLRTIWVRHGEDMGQHQQDAPRVLSARGEQQAKCTAMALANVPLATIYCSDLPRSHQTGYIIGKVHADTHQVVTRAIREIGAEHAGGRPPGDETQRRIMGEELQVLDAFLQELRRHHPPGEQVLLVTHGNLIRFILLLPRLGALQPGMAMRLPPQLAPRGARQVVFTIHNASISIIDVAPDQTLQVRLLAHTGHLRHDLKTAASSRRG